MRTFFSSFSKWSFLVGILLVSGFPSMPSWAEDTVTVETPQGRRTISGTITAFNSAEGVVIQLGDGRTQAFPAGQVIDLAMERSITHREADVQFGEKSYDNALILYRKARQEEERVWVRQYLTAMIVRCHRALGEIEAAAQEFFLLARMDKRTPYLAAIPLPWYLVMPSPSLMQQAEKWIDREENPSARLMAAGLLLSSDHRAAALRALDQLAFDADRNIALLAVTQRWRTKLVTLKREDLPRWEKIIASMSPPFRAGPYYLLGNAYEKEGEPEEAVLRWMRIPILHQEQRPLAARALLESARSFIEQRKTEKAIGLLREVTDDYSDTPSAESSENLLRSQIENENPP